jgi:hypothetical protein
LVYHKRNKKAVDEIATEEAPTFSTSGGFNRSIADFALAKRRCRPLA